MIFFNNNLIQNEDMFPDISVDFMNLPTPFGGRSAASSGPRWAIPGCSASVSWTFPGLQYDGHRGRTGNTSSSQSRGISRSGPRYSTGFTYPVIAPPCPARGPEAGSPHIPHVAPEHLSFSCGASS